jgi:sialate O-acetylesterase
VSRRGASFGTTLGRALPLLLLLPLVAVADVRLPRLLGDGVVLQRDTGAALWGWADEGEAVTVLLDDVPAGKTIAAHGKWRIVLAPHAAGGPHRITVDGKNRLTIDDAYFGDVWIASGQSNMELPMERVKERYPAVIAHADFPLIRRFIVSKSYDFDGPHADLAAGAWEAATPQSIMQLSAVGFFFAKALYEHYRVPIGIVQSAYGGATAESWMSETALEEYPQYLALAKRYRDKQYLQGLVAHDHEVAATWQEALDEHDAGLGAAPPWYAQAVDDSDWQTMTVPGYWADNGIGEVNGAVWFRRTFELPDGAAGKPAKLMLGRIVDADTTWLNGVEVGTVTYQYPPRRYEVAAGVLQAGTNTIAVRVVSSAGRGGFITDKPYWIRVGDTTVDLKGRWRARIGAVSNPISPPLFRDYKAPLGIYNAMLAPLAAMTIKGVIWYQGESNADRPAEYARLFPDMIRDWRRTFGEGDFPFLFVQLPNYLASGYEPSAYDWPAMRNAQSKALELPNTAMVVTIDVGEWNDLHPTRKQPVGERLALAARHVAYGEDLTYSGPTLRSLEARGRRLLLHFDHTGSGLEARGNPPGGFDVAGRDGHFVPAKAKILGDVVEVWSDAVDDPVAARYAWADNPATANLYNFEGLPAAPFEARVPD